jgi:beta-lactamase class A
MDTTFENPQTRTLALMLSGVALLVFFFWLGGYMKSMQYADYFNKTTTRRVTDDPYPLVAPLIGTETPSALLVGRFISVNKALKGYADAHKDEVDTYSVYYRDLNSSQWFGINEKDAYIPASLLKIALAITYLKEEEGNPSFRFVHKVYTQKIASINTSVPYLEPSKLVIGHEYTTEELLRRMMVDSDNGAKDLLFATLDKNYFYDLFKLIGIQQPKDALSYRLSAADYAFFLRMLYNGTYLTAENSEKILDIMTQSEFTEGLVAGVPGVTVAHKYGTYTLTDDSGNKNGVELHDCGIIYDKDHPYILCIMTKGTDADKLASFIAGMSTTAYQSVQDYFAK